MKQIGIKPQVIEEICYLAEKCNLDIVILFGSRARGDYGRASDIDLAVSGGSVIEFTIDVNEETSTLLKFDVVDLSKDVQNKLLESIKQEGIILYEKV